MRMKEYQREGFIRALNEFYDGPEVPGLPGVGFLRSIRVFALAHPEFVGKNMPHGRDHSGWRRLYRKWYEFAVREGHLP